MEIANFEHHELRQILHPPTFPLGSSEDPLVAFNYKRAETFEVLTKESLCNDNFSRA